MKIIIFLFLTLCLRAQATVKVLSYSSLLDKGGLGEEITRLGKVKGLTVEFSSAKDFSGMLGNLRRLKREKSKNFPDVVLGLNENNYFQALREGLIKEGKVFEEATYSFLVDKTKFPEKEWPKTWDEARVKLAGKIIVQDPRTSEVGLNWLLNATSLKNLSLADAKKLPKKVFPTWSAAFAAFDAGLAPVIWTYATSAAYYQCNSSENGVKSANELVNLPLPHYPKDKNYIALHATTSSSEATTFLELILSDSVQNQIWQKNWMFPAQASKQKMPGCFKKVWFPTDAKAIGSLDSKELLKQLDQWSL